MLKKLMLRRFALGVMALLVLSIVVLVFVFAQEEQLDSTQMKLIRERVRVTVRGRVQYELLKQMVGECPPYDSTHGEPWEFVINQWQRKQLEKTGAKVRVVSEIKPEEEPRQTEYKLVREIDLEKEQISGIVFGPKTANRPAMPQMAQRDYREILFYSPDFKLLHTYGQSERFTDVYPSKNLQYVGILTPVKIPTVDEPVGRIRFTLINNKGENLWEKEVEYYYDVGKNGYSVSNNGTVIERAHSSGFLTVYDQKGNEIRKTQLYIGTGDPGSQGIMGQFSEVGEYLLITIHEDRGMQVRFYRFTGEELWRFETKENSGGVADISNSNNYVIASTHNTTYLFSQQGNLIKKYENLFSTDVSFSSDEKYFVLTEYYHTAYLIRSEDGEIISNYSASKGSGSIYSSDVAVEAKAFGVLCSAMASLIGFDGRTLWSADFPAPEGPLFRMLNLSLSDDGKQIVIQIGTKIMIYQKGE
jgi:hypothetical protein